MADFKGFIKNRGVSLYISLIALVCGVAALILYAVTGVTAFTSSLNYGLIAALVVGIVINVASTILGEKLLKYAAYAVYLFALLQYVYVEITYIANVFVSIDGTSFSASFIMTFILCIAAAALMFASAVLAKDYLAGERVKKA
ncbi:MAG: hypothetical protein LUE27_07990 [Clostridia bacterium]|nr:hypothetical protein [Clostridia bacterium]